MRVIIAVAGRPPRGDAVDQFASVGKPDAAALVAVTGKRQRRGLHLRIGQPDVVEARRGPAGRVPTPLFSLALPDIRRFHGTYERPHIVPSAPG